MGRRLARAVAGVTDLRQIDEIMPFGRVCQPEDVAERGALLLFGEGVLPDRRAALRLGRRAGLARRVRRCPGRRPGVSHRPRPAQGTAPWSGSI